MEGIVRTARQTDAEDIQRIYAPLVNHTPISFELEVPSISEFKERLDKTLEQYPWLVYELNQRVVGYAYASTHRTRPAYQWSAEVTVYVDQDFRGRGIGKILYKNLFEILKKQGYRSAVGGITLPNSSSVAIHESLGFRQVASFKSLGCKLNAWHDVGFWQLELQPYELNPTPPVPFPHLSKGRI